jgi:hypothetical protein
VASSRVPAKGMHEGKRTISVVGKFVVDDDDTPLDGISRALPGVSSHLT